MQYSEIKSLFDAAFNGSKNFMTPTVVSYGKSGPWLYEISRGRGMLTSGPIYGVTVLHLLPDGNTDKQLPRTMNLNRCFNEGHAAADASIYARNLKQFKPVEALSLAS